MRIDTAPSRFDGPEIVDLRTAESRIVAIFDGTGSWEHGDALAHAEAQRLEIEWSWDFPRTAAQVARDVEANIFFGAALVTDGGCSVILRGSYGALRVAGGALDVIHQPMTAADAQVRAGLLTAAEAKVHPLRNVVMSDDWFVGAPVAAGVVVVADVALTGHLLSTPAEEWAHLRAAEMQALDGHEYPRPVIVVRL